MVHPCIPDYSGEGNELHACHSASSRKTVCKKKSITADDIDKTDGATLMCRDCYADAKGKVGPDNLVKIG